MKRGSPLNLKKGLRGPGRGAKLLYGENRVRVVHMIVVSDCDLSFVGIQFCGFLWLKNAVSLLC